MTLRLVGFQMCLVIGRCWDHVSGGRPTDCAVRSFLGVIALLLIATELRQVCPSVRPHGKLGSHWTDFHEILYLNIFRKYFEKIQVSLKSDTNDGTAHVREERYVCACDRRCVTEFFLHWETLQIKVAGKIETQFYVQ